MEIAYGYVTLGDREPRADVSEHHKLMQTKFLRVVKCKYYMKSRCMYSYTSPSKMKVTAINGSTEPTAEVTCLLRKIFDAKTRRSARS